MENYFRKCQDIFEQLELKTVSELCNKGKELWDEIDPNNIKGFDQIVSDIEAELLTCRDELISSNIKIFEDILKMFKKTDSTYKILKEFAK